jgi:hypothetical protein
MQQFSSLNGKPQNECGCTTCIARLKQYEIISRFSDLESGKPFFQNGQRDAVVKIDVFTSVVESKGNMYIPPWHIFGDRTMLIARWSAILQLGKHSNTCYCIL